MNNEENKTTDENMVENVTDNGNVADNTVVSDSGNDVDNGNAAGNSTPVGSANGPTAGVPENTAAKLPNNTSENKAATRNTAARAPEQSTPTEFKPMEKMIRANLATLKENPKSGWKRMVTVMKWGTGMFKLDIRDWNSDMTRSTKGMTFARSEVEKLRNILSILDLSIIDEYQQSDGAFGGADNELKKAV